MRFLLLLVLFYSFCLSALSLTDFNVNNDYEYVVGLMKKEWIKLFPSPNFNDTIVNKMLLKKIPGNTPYSHRPLHVKIIKDENKAIGFITYYFATPNIGYIELFAIDKPFQSKGYGKKTINYIAKEMADNGMSSLYLYVYTSNPKAIEFYTKLGFKHKEQYPGYLLLALDISSFKTREMPVKNIPCFS